MSWDKLREYQKEDVMRMHEQIDTLNANDMGLGKTVEVISMHNYIGAMKTLIIAPTGLMYGWKAQIEKWALYPCNKVVIVEGSTKKRHQLLQEEANFYIINKEMLRHKTEEYTHPKTAKVLKRQVPEYYELFQGVIWDIVCVDEIHQYSNRKAKQFEGLKKLRTRYKVGLTGTPIQKVPQNIWSILNWLNPGKYTSYWKFVEKYCETKASYFNPHAKDIIGINKFAEPELQKELQHIMIRRLKSDAAKELPEKIYKTIPIKLEGEQERIYKQVEKEMVLTYEKTGIDELDMNRFLEDDDVVFQKYGTIFERDLRLRQICLSPKLVGGKLDSAKIDTILTLIEGRSGPVCIFSMYKGFIKILEEVIKKELNITPAVIHGDKSAQERALELEAFNKGHTEVFLGTIGSAGTGVDGLQVAGTLIFSDKDYRPKVNQQVEDRIHRIGQMGSVEIISLVCVDTIEEDMEEILENRDKVINRLVIANEVYRRIKTRQ